MVQDKKPQAKTTIKLGVWGTKSAGKTVYMLMLYHYLKRSKKKDKFLVKVDDEETDKFLKTGLKLIIDKGDFPSATIIKEEYSSYSYKLKRVNSDTIVELTFLDLSGEFLKNRERKVKIKNASDNENDNVSVAEYFTRCDGILILLSPLKEDYREEDGDSYLTLLEDLFRLMQGKIPESQFKLEQYVVFGITKADNEEIYQRTIDSNFDRLIMETIGSQASLEWLESYFYIEIEEKNGIQQVNLNGENNRCCFLPISPFSRYKKDGKMISPVVPNENKTEDELNLNESQQEQPKAADMRHEKQRKDPFKKNSSKKQNHSNDDYDTPSTANYSEDSERESQSSSNEDYETPSTANNYEANQKTGKYKIDKSVIWKPLNVVEPIEWLIERIENHPRKIVINEQQQSNNS